MERRSYIFNPAYRLVNDKDRILIINARRGLLDKSILCFIHPIHARMLALFDGRYDLPATLEKVSSYFQITPENAEKLVTPFIENPGDLAVRYDGDVFVFPPEVLVPNEDGTVRKDLPLKGLTVTRPLNFKRRRLSRPQSLLVCINLTCYTDCIYCYANRRYPYIPMPTKRLLEVIGEAKSIGVKDLDFTGGEFFLHKDWPLIAEKYVQCGYSPEISTKIPLSREIIDEMVRIGMPAVQFSLDTLDPELAVKTLRVAPDYIDKILESISYADSKGLEIIIKPTLCRYTCSTENIRRVVEFARGLKHVRRCIVSVAGYSMYKSEDNYRRIRPTKEQTEAVGKYVSDISSSLTFPIRNDNQIMDAEDLCSGTSFRNRSMCSANVDGFVVLPDGKVTLCEELYWNPHFIIGDVTRSSLQAIWDSPEARSLWNLEQEALPRESACRTCSDFAGCRSRKGVCWKYVIGAYGQNNVFYPDPRCPLSPACLHDIIGEPSL